MRSGIGPWGLAINRNVSMERPKNNQSIQGNLSRCAWNLAPTCFGMEYAAHNSMKFSIFYSVYTIVRGSNAWKMVFLKKCRSHWFHSSGQSLSECCPGMSGLNWETLAVSEGPFTTELSCQRPHEKMSPPLGEKTFTCKYKNKCVPSPPSFHQFLWTINSVCIIMQKSSAVSPRPPKLQLQTCTPSPCHPKVT
jgi:hypothetical protein